MNINLRALVPPAVGLTLLSCASWGAETPQMLGLKFAKGDRARYELILASKAERGEPTTSVPSKIPSDIWGTSGTDSLEMQMMTVVKKLDGDGSATVDMTIQGLRHISPPVAKMGIRLPGPSLAEIRGGVFKTKVSPRGEQVRSRSFDSIVAMGTRAMELHRIQGTLYPELPDNPVSVGDKWEESEKINVSSDMLTVDGEMKSAYKFEGVEEKEGIKLAVVSVEGAAEFKAAIITPGASNSSFTGTSQRTGKYYVSLNDQRLVSVHLDEKVKGEMSNTFTGKAQGTYPVSYEHSVDFRLLENKRTAELFAKVDKMKVDPGFKEVPEVIDFQDSLVRFSHGNHKARAAMFKEKFGEEYRCGLCHNGDLPGYDEIPQEIKGKPFETVDEIRNEAWRYPPYGAGMNNCLKSCHDDKTAPGNCELCHVQGSKVLQGE